ncbi:MAG: diguanylate cyclase [Eubacterium sp.]|nr:diguanylate cyclase [Eubacterium sp.]
MEKMKENTGIIEKLKDACANQNGILTILRIDNIDDFYEIYGEDMSQALREECISVLNEVTEEDDIKACLGNDEFVLFCKDMKSKSELSEIYFHLTNSINRLLEESFGEDSSIYMGMSMGAVMVPEFGNVYEELFEKAAKVLDFIREEGRHYIAFYDAIDIFEVLDAVEEEMEQDTEYDGAMVANESNYEAIREFMSKYVMTYKNPACEVTINLDAIDDDINYDTFQRIITACSGLVGRILRKSDVITVKDNVIKLLLPELSGDALITVLSRIENRLVSTAYVRLIRFRIESSIIGPERELSACNKAAI